MAEMTNKVSLEVGIVNKTTGEFEKISQDVAKLNKEATKASAGMVDFAKKNQQAFTTLRNVGAVGLASITGFVGLAIKSFAGAQIAVSAMNATIKTFSESTIKSMGGSFDEVAKKITDAGQALQDRFGVDAEDASASLARLTKMTGDFAQAQQLMALAMDLSAAKGVDLQTSINAVSKMYQGSARELQAFGIAVTDTMTTQQKFLVLQGTIAGQAEAKSKTLAGQMTIMAKTFGDAMENIGAAFEPILTNIVSKIIPVVKAIGDWVAKHPALIVAITATTAALSALLLTAGTIGLAIPKINAGFILISKTLGFLQTGLIAVGNAVKFLALSMKILWASNPWVLAITVSIGALIAIFVALTVKFTNVKKAFVDMSVAVIRSAIQLASGFMMAFNAITGLLKDFLGGVMTVFGKVASGFDWLMDKFGKKTNAADFFKNMSTSLHESANRDVEDLKAWGNTMMNAGDTAKGAFDSMKVTVGGAIGKMSGDLKGLSGDMGGVGGASKEMKDKYSEAVKKINEELDSLREKHNSKLKGLQDDIKATMKDMDSLIKQYQSFGKESGGEFGDKLVAAQDRLKEIAKERKDINAQDERTSSDRQKLADLKSEEYNLTQFIKEQNAIRLMTQQQVSAEVVALTNKTMAQQATIEKMKRNNDSIEKQAEMNADLERNRQKLDFFKYYDQNYANFSMNLNTGLVNAKNSANVGEYNAWSLTFQSKIAQEYNKYIQDMQILKDTLADKKNAIADENATYKKAQDEMYLKLKTTTDSSVVQLNRQRDAVREVSNEVRILGEVIAGNAIGSIGMSSFSAQNMSVVKAPTMTNAQKKTSAAKRSHGGFVQGSAGIDNVPMNLTAGELVLNKAQQSTLASQLSSPRSNSIVINISGNNFGSSNKNAAEEMGNMIMQKLKMYSNVPSF